MRLGNLEARGRNPESHDQSIACADCLKMPRVWGPPEETVLLTLLPSSLPLSLVSSPNVMVFYSVENNGNVLTHMQFFFQSHCLLQLQEHQQLHQSVSILLRCGENAAPRYHVHCCLAAQAKGRFRIKSWMACVHFASIVFFF